jgi:hypothetical protein
MLQTRDFLFSREEKFVPAIEDWIGEVNLSNLSGGYKQNIAVHFMILTYPR